MTDLVVVLTTFPDADAAASVARSLVEEGLVACAQVGRSPVRSWYRWQGSLQVDEEFVLTLKSTEDALPRLERRLRALHPYDTPQFVVLEARASVDYGDWVREQVESEADDPES